jgi:hypothetical protein
LLSPLKPESPLREIFIGLGIDQISQRSPEIKGLGSVLQGGIDFRRGSNSGVNVFVPVHEGNGLAIVDQQPVFRISFRFSPKPVRAPH